MTRGRKDSSACGLRMTDRLRMTGLKNGADDGSRTRDLELGKLALYQLSYVRLMRSYNPSGALPQQLGFGGENGHNAL